MWWRVERFAEKSVETGLVMMVKASAGEVRGINPANNAMEE